MRPARITRAVPPPPRRSSTGSQGSATSSARQSPRKGEFDTSPPTAQYTAALSRRAPVPPHRSGSSSSVSPTSSPPPRMFEREGAPSPPSLKALSNIEDEDESEYVEDDSGEFSLPHENNYRPREDRGMHHGSTRSSSPDPILVHENARSLSSSPVPRPSPPPVPSSRPPIPIVRRSIPPPPRPESPPASRSRPASRASAIVPRGSGEDDDKATIRKAAARPAMPPPRGDEFRDSQGRRKEIMEDEEGGE
jgi:hypothetical protein